MIINHTNIPNNEIKLIISLIKEKIGKRITIIINNEKYMIKKILGIIIINKN